ncbi:MAG: hypothetical protein HND58_01580 [Planctomycetota bacterium]|nr:MAG: hypothetical protein HND58_01580 [Planctomycetota bacterium]
MKTTPTLLAFGLSVAIAESAGAQMFSIPWHTIDNGGGSSVGGSFVLTGTIGQHDAHPSMTGGGFTLTGGFWAADEVDVCVGDFNGDGTVNTLDVLAFLNAWTAGEGSADINGDGTVNTLDVLAFLNAWTAGC